VDEATARWACRPIPLGPPDNAFRPLVIGPGGVPRVVDQRRAAAAPELAVLSALAHAKGPEALRVATAAVSALEGLDDGPARYCYDLIWRALPNMARRALEAEMMRVDPKLDTPMVRKVLAIGRTEGRAEGIRGALLTLLAERGIDLDARTRTQVERCDDLGLLDLWIRRAVVGTRTRDVFDTAPSRRARRAGNRGSSRAAGGASRRRAAGPGRFSSR
jgi:hypothetical protein